MRAEIASGRGWPYVSFAPDSKTLVTPFNRRICLWDVESGKKSAVLEPDQHDHPDYYDTAVFSPDGKIIAAENRIGGLELWDVERKRMTASIAVPGRGWILGMAFSPDGRMLAALDVTGTAYLWEVSTRKKRATFRGASKYQSPLAFSPDGRFLAMACSDDCIKLWDLTGVKRKPPDAEEISRLWSHLGGNDAAAAYRAIRTLSAFPAQTLPMLRKQLGPLLLSAEESRKMDALVRDLDSDTFAIREHASAELQRLGLRAEATLQRALAGKPSPEVRRRVLALLEGIEPLKEAERIRQLRALEVLEHMGTPEARVLLEELAQRGCHARLTQESKASLDRLKKRPVAKR